MKKSQKGFTLVELIVVIAIIGVLAAILVPNMINYVGKSKVKTANTNAKEIYTASTTYCTDRSTDGDPVKDGYYFNTATACKDAAGAAITASTDTNFIAGIKENLGADSANAVWGVQVSGDVPVAAVFAKAATDSYVGSYPIAVSGKTQVTGGLASAKLGASAAAG